MLKKILLGLIVTIMLGLGLSNTYADTIGGSFSSIPIQIDNTDTTDITSDLNLKAGGLVDSINGIYYTVGGIPASWSGNTVAGINVTNSCSDLDANSTCVNINKPALFIAQGDNNGVVLKKIIQLTKNGTTAGVNWWGLHKNTDGNVFLLENIGADMRIWTIIPGTNGLVDGVLSADSPTTLDTNIDAFQGISIVDDYLFYHGSVNIRANYHHFPRFTVISLNGTTPTLVYQWGKYINSVNIIALKLSQDVSHFDDVTPSMIQGVTFIQNSNDLTIPYSSINALKQGYNYMLYSRDYNVRHRVALKGMFVKDNKLYAIAYLYDWNSTYFFKATLNADGTINYGTNLTSMTSASSVYNKVGRYFVMQFDFSPVSQ